MMRATPSTLRRSPAAAEAATKRRRLRPPLLAGTVASPSSTPPSSPLPPILCRKADPATAAASRSATRRSLAASFASAAAAPATAAGSPQLEQKWQLLGVTRSELSLPLTLPTGQSFRWREMGPDQYTGVIGRHLVSLKHVAGDPEGQVAFRLHGGAGDAESAVAVLREYLNLDIGISLTAMWHSFAAADSRFAELSQNLAGGVRVLRQDPVECLFQFLCSSNNNIARIERMVNSIASFGEYLGTVDGVAFYEFPSVDRLAAATEEQLRGAGFGYRAKFIVNTAKALREKPGGGVDWLDSLRGLELEGCIGALCSLPGVGPKVAACIALFSLDHHHAIPVDTHVWQIATRDLTPELAGCRPSPKHFGRISEAFKSRFGRYAGWAQAALFVGELPSQKQNKKKPKKSKQTSGA